VEKKRKKNYPQEKRDPNRGGTPEVIKEEKDPSSKSYLLENKRSVKFPKVTIQEKGKKGKRKKIQIERGSFSSQGKVNA